MFFSKSSGKTAKKEVGAGSYQPRGLISKHRNPKNYCCKYKGHYQQKQIFCNKSFVFNIWGSFWTVLPSPDTQCIQDSGYWCVLRFSCRTHQVTCGFCSQMTWLLKERKISLFVGIPKFVLANTYGIPIFLLRNRMESPNFALSLA